MANRRRSTGDDSSYPSTAALRRSERTGGKDRPELEVQLRGGGGGVPVEPPNSWGSGSHSSATKSGAEGAAERCTARHGALAPPPPRSAGQPWAALAFFNALALIVNYVVINLATFVVCQDFEKVSHAHKGSESIWMLQMFTKVRRPRPRVPRARRAWDSGGAWVVLCWDRASRRPGPRPRGLGQPPWTPP